MAKKEKDDKYHPSSTLRYSIPTWSFLGFAAALIFGLFAIYSVFFYEKKPDFHVRVVSKAPVFSIREDVPGLEIIFNKQDIRKTKKGLSLLTVELSNTGNIAVKTGDFDDRAPLRLWVSTGNIIRSDVLNASTAYLEDVFKDVNSDSNSDSNSLRFPKFILEPDQFILFKLLILHDEEDVPSVLASGKIANISRIQVHDTSKMSADLQRKPSSFIDFIKGLGVWKLVLFFIVYMILVTLLYRYFRISVRKRRQYH